MRRHTKGYVSFCLLVCFSTWSINVRGADGTWILNGNGNWTGTPANWAGGIVPNAVSDGAYFSNDITANRTITLDAAVTLGGLQIGDALGGSVFTFAGTNALTLDNGLSNAFVNKYGSATDIWQAPLNLVSDSEFNIFSGTLQVNGASNATVPVTGSGNLIKNGAGQLQINGALSGYSGDYQLNLGTLAIGGANAATVDLGTGTGGITLTGTGSADRTVLRFQNNGVGNNGDIVYQGNNSVTVQGAVTIHVDRHFNGGTSTGNTVVLNNLNMDGGLLQVTGGYNYALRFDGTTTLGGQTNVFFPNTASSPFILAGPITDGASALSLIKEGAGRLVIRNSANSFGGITAVKNGVLQVSAGANLSSGKTYINGGVLTPGDAATLDAISANGLVMVGQLGTSRYILPAIGFSNAYGNINGSNPLSVDVPLAGMALAIDGLELNGNVTADIDLSQVGSGSSRVWVTNALGLDRTYQGTILPSSDGNIRLSSGGNNLIISGAANRLGGTGSIANLIFGYDHSTPANFAGAIVSQAQGGTVSVRVNNDTTGTVTIHRGLTVNVNGAINSPLGTGVVTILGGTLNTDNTSAAQFGNTDFRLYGGSTFLLDNSAVAVANADRRLQTGTAITLNSSTLRLLGGGAASSQTMGALGYAGGSTVSIDTDGATFGRLTTLTVDTLNRIDTGTLNIRNISNTATTFGTAAGTQKLLINSFAPTPTNGMIGANIVLWGGANATDAGTPLFVTYDATNGIQAATTVSITNAATLAAATTGQIGSLNGAAAFTVTGSPSLQALNIRSTANTNTVSGGTITLGSIAAPGQGAGLFLAHTSNNGITHSSNFAFGSQEGLIYAATTGGTSGSITLSGVLSGSNGVTRFGDGILILSGANTFTGPLTINSGETRLNNLAAAGGSATTPGEVNLYGGSLYLNASGRYYTNITVRDNARIGNVNVSSSGFNNLTIEPRTGSDAPVILWHQDQAGSNSTTVWGGLTLNGNAQFDIPHVFQVNGGISGTGNLDKYFNDRLILAGDSSSYLGNLTAYTSAFVSYNSGSTVKPFGATNAVTINPGGGITLAAPTNINAGQVTLNSDHGGVSYLGQLYVADPATTLPSFTVNSSAPWKGAFGVGAVGFSVDIDQTTLFGGNAYLGAPLGYTGIYTGTLTSSASGFLLGTSQGAIRVAKPLTGPSNAVIGISMTGDSSRTDQFVNNSGGTVQFDVPMTYTGNTILNPGPLLRVSAKNALDATGDLIFAGGQLRVDSASGQNRMIAPISIANDIVMTADTTIQMENSAYEMYLAGNISLAPNSTGIARTLNVGNDQPGGAQNNAGILYLDGGISDGVGGSGNHFIKGGIGTLFFTGTNTYTGSTTLTGGLIGVNKDADWGNTSAINMVNGGIAVWENSFTTAQDYHVHGSNGYFDIAPGLTLTQDVGSVIDGGNSLMKRGLGTMVLNGTNAVTGLFVAEGVLQINGQASLGDPATTSSFSFGSDQTLGGATAVTRYTGGTVRINFTGATNRGMVFNNNGNTNFSGGIDITAGNTFTLNGAASQGTEFDFGFKTGAGTLVTTATNTMRSFVMANGTWQFGNAAPWANSTATTTDNTFIEMMGGTISALNTGANIALANNLSTTNYNYGGGMHLRMGSGGGFSIEFGADNLLRQNQGTLVLETATASGTTLGGTGGSNTGRVIVTNAVNTGLARASAVTNGIFPAHLIGADGSGSAFFLQNDAATGFVAYSGPAIASPAGLNPTSIGNITADPLLSGANNSVYALSTTSDISGGTLRVTAIDNVRMGGILINGSNTISSNLIFDPTSATAPGTGTTAEGLVYVKTGESAVLSGNVTANAFTKFGSGTLTLTGANMISGDLSVQDGIVRIGSAGALSRLNTELNINEGATLDLNGFNVAVETLGNNNRQVATTSLGGRVTNTSGTTGTLMMAGPISSAFNGVMDLNLRLVKAGSGVLTLNGYSASSPDAGNNSFTGGTDIYGVTSPSILAATTTNGSASITIASTQGLAAGMIVSGSGIPTNSYITAILSPTNFLISQNATASATVTLNSFGGLTLNNTTYGLGGYNGSTAGDVNLYSGNLNLFFSNTNTGVNGTQGQQFNNQVIKVGNENTDGITLNLRGPSTIYVNQGLVSSNSTSGQGNIIQVGALNLTNTTVTLGGGNLYRLRAAGPISILGSQITFQTNQNDGPSGALELTGKISGSGAITKFGDGILRGIVISNPNNTYSGGTNIVAGDVQVTATTGSALGTGSINVFPDGSLRIAGNGSINGSKLTVMSRVNALGAVVLDDNFNPTVLTSSNFSSVYNTALQLGQPYFTQALNMSAIGDGRAFLGGGLNAEIAYTAATLGAGVADAWNPGVGVYRIAPGASSFAFSGVDNVLTGANYLQVGPQRQNVLGGITNGANVLVIRNSNNFTGGTQITKTASIYTETGGRATGETPLGTGAIEVYGELRVRGAQGSLFNASTGSHNNVINLRPGGTVRLHDADGLVATNFLGAGDQGRWGDTVGLDLNGGNFIYNGPANLNGVETIGDITARKGGTLQVFRNSTASTVQLNVGDISRAERGVLTIAYNSGFLGIPATTPLSYERITAQTISGAAIVKVGTTNNGSGVSSGGIVAPWIIDRTTNSFVGYNPTGADTGFQPLVSAAPGAGQIAYNKIVSSTWTAGLTTGSDIADITTNAKTLADNPSFYAMRSNQNISPTGVNNTITLTSGGLILTGGTINPISAVTSGVVSPMTLNFGPGGTGEAFMFVGAATSTVYANIVAAQGLTKFGPNQLNLYGINTGIGGAVVINEGTLFARLPFSGSGSPVGQVFNSQDVFLNAGALVLEPFIANAAGNASEIASSARAQALFNSNIFVQGDSTIGNNGNAQYAQLADLTIANSAGSSAMNGNSTITLALQSGLWVRGTTTLAPEARINGTFNGLSQSTLAGLVTGAGGIQKYGNGAITVLNGANDFAGGTTIWGTTNATAVSTVASAFRGVGTPFGVGDINIQPGGLLRIADNANIASNAVYLRSDAYGLGGIGLANNSALNLASFITSGTPLAGQIKVESTGPFAGVISLDYGYYSKPLDMAAIPGGDWWLGNSQQTDAYYFNQTLGTAASGKYLLGGGGNQSGVNIGSILVSAARTSLFENVLTGGSAGQVAVEVGAQTGDFAWNSPSFVNGNSGFIALTTRNMGLTGDVRVNTNTTLAVGNNFALGSGRLIMNGGNLRYDFGNNNFVTSSITLDNDVVLQGDWSTSSGNELVLNGNVAMSDVLGAGATRIWNLTGSGAMAVGLTGGSNTNGVISGAAGSNLIKRGAQQVAFRGNSTYEGYTQIDRGEIVVVGNVQPNVAGALGISNSPIVLGLESANNAGSLGIGGKFTVGRDIITTSNPGTGINLLRAMTNETATISGSISVPANGTLTIGAVSGSNTTGSGGRLEIFGGISGAGNVNYGTLSAVTSYGGTVALLGTVNGFGINTYSGTSTFNSSRVEIGGDTLYSGPANAPVIVSGPFGTGSMTWTSGEGGNGAEFLAVGGPRTIVNAFNATSSAANATWKFMGNQALTFTRDWNISSDATLRNRVLQVNNLYQPTIFLGNLSNTGAQGANLIKTGSGLLVLGGTNTQANLLTTDGNYGTGVFIDSGILRVNGNAALGSTAALAAAGPHLAGPADVRLRGGYLSVSSGFITDRQFILTNSSGGIDVAAGETLTLTKQTAGAFNLRKVGPGTLALNSNANTISALTLGGAQQLNSGMGYYSHTGGTVSTTATSGTPFATASITINSGTLSLVGGGTAQALSIPTLNYGGTGSIALNQGSTSSQLTIATALARQGAFNSVNYGTLTINPSALANLGVTEKLIVSAGAPANTALTGGDILTVPSIFVALAGSGQDANFARYDAVNGIREHTVTTVGTLAAGAAANVGDITASDIAGAGTIDIGALRTAADIAPTDITTLIRINNGGLIFNGATAPIISADVLFGTAAATKEALVYVRDGQTGVSTLSGSVTALDFTKTGAGTLELSGAANVLNSGATRLPVLSVQNGAFRFGNAGAQFTNARRPTSTTALTGSYVLNVNEAGVFDLNGINTLVGGLTGNGTVSSGVAGAVNFTSRNGFGVDTTFSGGITDGAGVVTFTKSGNGILSVAGHSSHTGGTVVEAGRVTVATGNATPLGRLEPQTVTALGTGPITLAGGDIRFNAATLLNSAQSTNEVTDGIDTLLWGGANGYDITVASSAYTNGVLLPANTTSNLRAVTQNALVGSLTINAPQLNSTEGLVFVKGATTFSLANTTLRTAGGRLFLQGKINAAGKTITKTGANDVVISHTEGGVDQNQVGLWKVYGGLLNPRSADGAANPLGANAIVELNGGSTNYGLLLSTDGDGTAASERVTTYANTTIRFGSPLPVSSNEFVSSAASRIGTDRILGTNDDKTIVIGNLEVRGALGSPFSYFINANLSSLWVNGTTNFERDWVFQADGVALTFNGVISGNGTVNRKSNGASVYFNAENTWTSGTFLVGGGRNIFGSYEGNQVTLSETAKFGYGHIFQGPLSTFQVNGLGNLRNGQNIYVGGNLSWAPVFSLAADVSLDQIRLRALGLGGIQSTASDYYLNSMNPSAAVLALGTVYTQPLDMRAIGDGMWFLGSATNMVGANGAYDADTLAPGLGNTYRLGAGGSSLFFGTNGNENVLTDTDATCVANLIVGAPMTVQNGANWNGASGTVVLLQNQNYTGTTVVNRSSTLDFRGTLTTSSMNVYGTVNVAGEKGTFINPNTNVNIPVTLRPGATLRFDNNSGVLPITATEGRWGDTTPIALNNSILRLQGNTGVEVVETVGAISASGGTNQIQIVRGVIGRGTELRSPSLTRVGNSTIQFTHNGSQLGSDERLILTTAPTVTNGMVEPWMISASDVQFLTYNADTGFTIAGFDRVQAAATLAASVAAPTERTFFSGNVVLGGSSDFSTYALRLDGNVTLGTATNDTSTGNRLILGSGGLISNGTRTITAGIWAGAGGTSELILYNNGTTAIGDLSNVNTAGQVRASGITKFGAGLLQFLGNNAGFNGDIRIQQGTVELNYRNLANVATDVATTIGGDGGNIIFEGAGTVLNLRAGQDGTNLNFTGTEVSFNKGIVLADYVPLATISTDRSAGTAGTSQNKTVVLLGGLTFGLSDNDVGQILRIDGRNGLDLRVNGTTTLNGRSAIAVENGYTNTASDVILAGQVTGTGTLIKGPSDSKARELNLTNVNSLNDYTNGTVLQGGTLRVLARSANVAAGLNTNLVAGGIGNGDVTVMQGVLDLRFDSAATGAADTDLEFVRFSSTGTGPNLFVNGSTQINADRAFYTGTFSKVGTTVTALLPGGHDFTVGQSINVTSGSNGATSTNYTITAATANSITYTDSTGATTAGVFVGNNNSGTTKMATFNNLTIGSQILTLTGGNSYGIAFEGATTLLGNAYFNNSTDVVLGGASGAAGTGSIATDGGAIIFNKNNTGTLWIHSANPGLAANVYVNAGLLAFGNRAVGNVNANLGAGDIFVNPGAQIQVRGMGNINTALGQEVKLTGTQYAAAIMRTTFSATQAQLQSLIQATTPGVNQVTMLSIEATQSSPLDLSTIGNGRLYLGASGDRTYNAASLAPGLPNLPNSVIGGDGTTNNVYRFGHQSGNTLTVNLSGTGNLTDVGGTTDVQIGNMAILGPNGNLGSNGFVYFQDQNTYTGQTVVSHSINLRFNTSMSAGDAAGPLGVGAGGTALVDVYGGLRIEAGGSVRNNAGTANYYQNIQLHPTSLLTFQDMTATGANSNRWDDNTGINLDGSYLVAEATAAADNNMETVGAINFDRGSRIQLATETTGDAFLTAASITRATAGVGAGTGHGTMVFLPTITGTGAVLNFGGAAVAASSQQQLYFTAAPITSATSAVPNMLPGYFMDGSSHRFAKIGANGITPVVDGDMVAMPTGAGTGAEVVNITATTTMGSFETSIYALRGGAFTLNSPTGANNDATVILGGSGADVGSVASFGSFTINPNLQFGATGTNEGIFYTGSTLTVNGNITAGSITKFGTGGTLVITNDQSDAARGIGNGYQGGWVVNEGALQFGQFGSAGNAVATNTIVLNGATAGSAQLNLRAQPADSLLNYTYTSGKIYAVDFATIDWDPGADDRVHSIADIEIQQSGGMDSSGNTLGLINGTVDAYFRVANNRNRSILSAGTLTVASNAILNVDTTAGISNLAATANNTSYLTNSISSGMSVASLIGTNRLTKWGDGTLYVRGDSSSTFSGTMVIDQGSVYVTHNGSLGTGDLTVNRYGVLEVGVANFVPTNASVTYTEGSMERWSVDSARSGTLDLGPATLQISADQPTTSVAVTLNGGGLQAYLRGDDHNGAQSSGGVLRTLNPNVTFTLAGDSFIGDRYYEGANGLDSGKQTNDNRPMEEYLASGAILDVQGVISGAGGLTKVGYDTVILSGSNTYAGATALTGGKLMIGKDDALPITTGLATTSNAVLDLNGQNQTVGSLTNIGVTATGVNSTSGFITNSSTTVKTLTVGNGASTDFTYAGVIQHNVALTKTGTAALTLNNANTYRGATTIYQGTVALGAAGTIDDSPWINIAGGAATLDVSAKTGGYTYDGRISGGGNADAAGTAFGSLTSAAKINGNVVVGDHVGEICLVGSMAPGGNSTTGDIATAGDQIGHIYTNGNLVFSGEVAGSTPAVPVTRLSMQLNGATVNASTLSGWDMTGTWLAANAPDYLNGVNGNLGNHDYLNVGGDLTLNADGRIVVTNFGTFTPAFGEVFNLIDWGTADFNTFSVNPTLDNGTGDSAYDLDLPELSSGLAWDTSLFVSHGSVFIVPEPGRMALLFIGLLGLCVRRRRNGRVE